MPWIERNRAPGPGGGRRWCCRLGLLRGCARLGGLGWLALCFARRLAPCRWRRRGRFAQGEIVGVVAGGLFGRRRGRPFILCGGVVGLLLAAAAEAIKAAAKIEASAERSDQQRNQNH